MSAISQILQIVNAKEEFTKDVSNQIQILNKILKEYAFCLQKLIFLTSRANKSDYNFNNEDMSDIAILKEKFSAQYAELLKQLEHFDD